MRVLVTGGTGFTGKALVRRMVERGHEVTALDCQDGYKTDEIESWGVRLVKGTVTDAALVERCVSGMDVVFHVAAAFRDVKAPPSHYREVNVTGTRLLLDAALRQGVGKFVYCSTCGVHGGIDHPPADEGAPIKPEDYYQQSKYDAEPLVLDHARRGLRATILRPAAIYGPGDLGRYFLIFRQLGRRWFPVFGSGKVLYHSLYIDNFLDAFELAMDPERGNGEAYLIADDGYQSIEELVSMAAQVMGVEPGFRRFPLWPLVAASYVMEAACKPLGIDPPLHPRRLEWYTLDRAFDIGKARRELGYEPRVGLADGLRRTWEWYKAEGLL